ncbi:hypothetical protein ACFQNF_15300 [Iodobacter arcticus]|uniref:Lipoprotein n=1 Tax=Iodobacter arcticus TaxID=590593 RepID=A0ABW2R049_9NEIS
MKIIAASLLLATSFTACSEHQPNKPNPSTPPAAKASKISAHQAKKIMARGESCLHFSREFAGDQSARDRELNQKMDKLKCDTIISELETLQQHLPKNSPLKAKVQALLLEY